MKEYEFIIGWKKIEMPLIDNKNIAKLMYYNSIMRCRNAIFISMTLYFYKKAGLNIKDIKKNEDHYEIVFHTGTQSECVEMHQKVENAGINTVKEMYNKFLDSKILKKIPRKLQSKIQNIEFNNNQKPMENIRLKLLMLFIHLYTDVKEGGQKNGSISEIQQKEGCMG